MDRSLYTERLLQSMNKKEVKILTGVRGVGKTSLLNLFHQKLLENGVKNENIIRINLESIEYNFTENGSILYDFINQKIKKEEKNFLLIDEIQRVDDWQSVIGTLKAESDIDIYISSSGKNIIDNKLIKKINHTPLEIQVFPLSFREYCKFHKSDESIDKEKLFADYLKFGSMPVKFENLRELFFSTMAQDVFIKNKIADNSIMLLLTKILFTEIGKIHSFNSISNILSEIIPKPPAVRTIENYINMLVDAKLLYSVPVFDVKSNNRLTRYAKYYPVDLGFYSLIMGEHNLYDVHILETVIYFELIRLGVNVSTCKIGNKKVTFLAESDDNKIYIHVTNNIIMKDVKSMFLPLRSINDHYSKWIMSLDEKYYHSNDGIRVSNIIKFLLED